MAYPNNSGEGAASSAAILCMIKGQTRHLGAIEGDFDRDAMLDFILGSIAFRLRRLADGRLPTGMAATPSAVAQASDLRKGLAEVA